MQDRTLLLHPPSSILSSQIASEEKVSGTEAPVAADNKKVVGSDALSASNPSAAADTKYKEFTHDDEKATDTNINISTIELKAEDLYDKEKVDLETIIIGDVFKLLQCDENGLTPDEVQHRLDLFGPNKLEQKVQNPFLQVPLFPLLFLNKQKYS
jgi:H+-transporting ATPase